MTTHRNVACYLLAVMAVVGCGPGDAVKPVALIGATLIDGSGGPPLPDAVVVVRGPKVEAVGARGAVDIPKGATEVDVSGAWIVPGLIDGNAMAAGWALPRFVAYGVTTIRDPQSQTSRVMALAEQANLNAILGPRIFLSGTPVGSPKAGAVTSANEARRAVDERSLAGVDFISADVTITTAMMKALVEESRSFDLPVSARPGLTDATTAAEAGVAVIDLLGGIPQTASGNSGPFYAAYREGPDAGWAYEEGHWSRLLPATLNRLAGSLAEQVTIVPALVYHETMSNLDDPTLLPRPERGAVPDSVASGWVGEEIMRAHGWSDADLREFRRARPVQDRFLATFHANRGRIAAGTASGGPFLVPGASLHEELELLVRAGLTPAQAIVAATGSAARVLRADTLGQIAAGKAADLIVLRADPLADIRNIRSIDRVMLRGVLMSADSLKAAW